MPDDIHIDSNEQQEDVLTVQIDYCPKCATLLENGFGLAGGGMGPYGFCSKCNRVVWKCQVAY